MNRIDLMTAIQRTHLQVDTRIPCIKFNVHKRLNHLGVGRGYSRVAIPLGRVARNSKRWRVASDCATNDVFTQVRGCLCFRTLLMKIAT